MVWRNQRDRRGVRIGLLLVVTALLMTALPSSAQEEQQEWIDWPTTFVTIGDPPADHEGTYEEFDCEGEQVALVATDFPGCGDFGGEHVRNSWYMRMGFRSTNAGNYGPVPLTGLLEARLTWGDRESVIVCEWDAGEFEGCRLGFWKWPSLGESFEFSCRSLEGAIGGWSECFMEHG